MTPSASATAPLAPPTNIRRTYLRELPHTLTFSEIHDYGKRLARRKTEWDVLDEKRKNAASQFKGQLASIGSDVARLTAAIDGGEEMRTVQCYEVHEGSHKVCYRSDTHAEVDRDPLSFEDQQESFPGMGDEADDAFVPPPSAPDVPTPVAGMRPTWTGGHVYVSPDDDELNPLGEAPAEPAPTPVVKPKRGRPAGTKNKPKAK